MIECTHEGCGRSFLDSAALADHADSVHTYDEIQRAVSNAVRLKYARQGTLGTPSVYAWIMDITDTWVVFNIEGPNTNDNMFKADYTMDASGVVTLSDPVAVVKKIVYVPAPKES